MSELVTIFGVALGIHLFMEVGGRWLARSVNGTRSALILRAIFVGTLAPWELAVWAAAATFAGDIFLPDLDWGRIRLSIIVMTGTCSILWIRRRAVKAYEVAYRHKRIWAEPTQVEMIGKVIGLGAWIFFLFGLCQVLGVDYRILLTFGGIGTLAIGLAGQQVFSNFFAGCMLYMTCPFRIGNTISSPMPPFEGRVEHIGWYMTRLRGEGGQPLYVPNSVFTSVVVVNLDRRDAPVASSVAIPH